MSCTCVSTKTIMTRQGPTAIILPLVQRNAQAGRSYSATLKPKLRAVSRIGSPSVRAG